MVPRRDYSIEERANVALHGENQRVSQLVFKPSTRNTDLGATIGDIRAHFYEPASDVDLLLIQSPLLFVSSCIIACGYFRMLTQTSVLP